MNNEDLLNIVSLCKKGNTEAQKKLFYLYNKQMMFVCRRYLSTNEECNDILTDSFILIFQSLSSYKFINEKTLYSWIRTIVTNQCINYVKKKQRERQIVDIEQYELLVNKIDDKKEEYEYSQEDLMQCLNNIPERLRLIFNMYVIEEYSIKEIAIRLETTANTIKTSLSQARLMLKQQLVQIKNKTC